MNSTAPKLWSPGERNALFGSGITILVNLLTLTALLRYVVKLPDDVVFRHIFKHILPAAGLMLFPFTVYYACSPIKLARKEGHDTVCALPSVHSGAAHVRGRVRDRAGESFRKALISSALPVRGRMPQHELAQSARFMEPDAGVYRAEAS